MIELRTDVEGIQAELVEVFAAAFDEADDVARFRDDQLVKHPARDGFRITVAHEHERIAGFAYGYTGRAGQWWTDRMRAEIAPHLYDEWFDGHFEFVELAVHPEFQRQGLGTALHDALLDGLPHDRALLTTWQDDRPARRLYVRRGWRPLAEVGDSTLMGRRLTRCP